MVLVGAVMMTFMGWGSENFMMAGVGAVVGRCWDNVGNTMAVVGKCRDHVGIMMAVVGKCWGHAGIM